MLEVCPLSESPTWLRTVPLAPVWALHFLVFLILIFDLFIVLQTPPK